MGERAVLLPAAHSNAGSEKAPALP